MFKTIVQYRPDYGKRPNKATFDPDGPSKRLAILKNPSNGINVLDSNGNVIDYELHLTIIANQIQSIWMLRGQKEPSLLQPEDFLWYIIPEGAFAGLPAVKLIAGHQGQKKSKFDLQNHS